MDATTDVVDTPETATKPVQVFKARGLSASVFPNRATVRDREVLLPKVRLQCRYKDKGTDEYKTTYSFGRDDLLPAQQLLGQAWQWIVAEEAKQKMVNS